VRVFWSSHLTPGHEAARQKWLSPVLESDAASEIKFSLPPFNNAGRLEFPTKVQRINAPAFGPNISNAVLNMYKSPEMKSLADRLNVHVPPNTLNKFIQGKMSKVHDMIRHCRETSEIADSSAAATQRLSQFVEEFEALDGASISSMSDWDAFVDRHVAPGWKARMHFDHLLGNFGFEKEVADTVRRATFTREDGETVTFEAHACRWLGKALGAYGPEGCLVDVVNLVFAMTSEDPEGLSDVDIADRIDAFYRRVDAKDTASLWIPTHFFMDAELDDCLAWVLLERVLDGLEPRLSVLIQLPACGAFDAVAKLWEGRPGCEIWRDPDSRNAGPLSSLFLNSKDTDNGKGKDAGSKGKGKSKPSKSDSWDYPPSS